MFAKTLGRAQELHQGPGIAMIRPRDDQWRRNVVLKVIGRTCAAGESVKRLPIVVFHNCVYQVPPNSARLTVPAGSQVQGRDQRQDREQYFEQLIPMLKFLWSHAPQRLKYLVMFLALLAGMSRDWVMVVVNKAAAAPVRPRRFHTGCRCSR